MQNLPDDCQAARILGRIRQDIPLLGLTPAYDLSEPWPDRIARLSDEELLGAEQVDPGMATCIRSGLLLRGDFQEESHDLSQRLGSAEGSYWHAIMHRLEPDYPNSKYWFNRVGPHAIFEQLAEAAPSITDAEILAGFISPSWDPFGFTDACETAVRGQLENCRLDLEQLQELEFDLLFAHCYQLAIGSPV
tara:strand:- start:7064 stop:7636 length:573 start_codon:yes stop_codon:yes gene_type:complete